MWLVAGMLGIAITAAVFAVLAVAARLMPAGRGRELAGFIPNCLVLLRRLRADRRLPRRARLALGAAAVYLISPVQLIPNFIPVIGQADDFVVVLLALRHACRRLPRDEVRAAWPGDPDHLDRLLGRPVPTAHENLHTST
ncbi:MAG: hypothetical protein NVS3B21_19240 [Acidimicrobiales bacterium]